VYSAGHADKDLMASHLVNYRFLPEKDRMLQIFFFVLSQLTYTEVPDKVRTSIFDHVKIKGNIEMHM